MNKLAVKAVAKLTHVNVQEAVMVTRHNPILGSEIHIEEELINLEESINTYHLATGSLDNYPSIKRHLLQEKRLILKHCIGLIVRMLQGRKLPQPYTAADVNQAVRRLARLVVYDAQRANIRIDGEVIEAVQPLLNVRQRYTYWDKPWAGLHVPLIGRFMPARMRA